MSSNLGQGSRFVFVLNMPAAPVLHGVVAINSVAIQVGVPGAKGTRALIVDDNPIACDILQSMGESLGWRCDVVAAGEDALEQLSEPATQPYQVVLVDWNMHGLDGWATALRFLQLAWHHDKLVVLMVSAQGREKYDASIDGGSAVCGWLFGQADQCVHVACGSGAGQ